MIPILYQPNETVFDHNGEGALIDVISCEVTECLNGAYEAVIVYPVSGVLYDQIKEDCIISI